MTGVGSPAGDDQRLQVTATWAALIEPGARVIMGPGNP